MGAQRGPREQDSPDRQSTGLRLNRGIAAKGSQSSFPRTWVQGDRLDSPACTPTIEEEFMRAMKWLLMGLTGVTLAFNAAADETCNSPYICRS
jgi:hypothetical protein